MARLNLPPTKSSRLALKRDLEVAREGHRLLEQKKQVLALEMVRVLRELREVRSRQLELQKQVLDIFGELQGRLGVFALERLAQRISTQHAVSVQMRSVAGVKLPKLSLQIEAARPKFGILDGDVSFDSYQVIFLEYLQANIALAELEASAKILAEAFNKTKRRVNALEQISIPDLEQTIKHIDDVLEGKEIESFFVTKLIKERVLGETALG